MKPREIAVAKIGEERKELVCQIWSWVCTANKRNDLHICCLVNKFVEHSV